MNFYVVQTLSIRGAKEWPALNARLRTATDLNVDYHCKLLIMNERLRSFNHFTSPCPAFCELAFTDSWPPVYTQWARLAHRQQLHWHHTADSVPLQVEPFITLSGADRDLLIGSHPQALCRLPPTAWCSSPFSSLPWPHLSSSCSSLRTYQLFQLTYHWLRRHCLPRGRHSLYTLELFHFYVALEGWWEVVA